jgi:hypothetical protein
MKYTISILTYIRIHYGYIQVSYEYIEVHSSTLKYILCTFKDKQMHSNTFKYIEIKLKYPIQRLKYIQLYHE